MTDARNSLPTSYIPSSHCGAARRYTVFTHARLLKMTLYKIIGTAFLHARFLALLFNGCYGTAEYIPSSLKSSRSLCSSSQDSRSIGCQHKWINQTEALQHYVQKIREMAVTQSRTRRAVVVAGGGGGGRLQPGSSPLGPRLLWHSSWDAFLFTYSMPFPCHAVPLRV
jgi:hypothetical protein